MDEVHSHIATLRTKNLTHLFYVFVNGFFSPELSDTHPVIQITDKLSIHVPKNAIIEQPIHLVFLQTEHTSTIKNAEHAILAEENSQITVIKDYIGLITTPYTIHTEVDIFARSNARVHLYKVQRDDFSATHTADFKFHQSRDSQIHYFSFTTGAQTTRENLQVALTEPGATCHLHGLYGLTQDNQQADYNLEVRHQAEHVTSTMLYKGILDKKSRAAFKGKAYVAQNAQKTNASQANHHLLLSNQADASSQPQLEIYADDIKCSHGATVGQLDPDVLFYLRSRGIDEQTATRLLVYSFAEEVIRKVKHASIGHYLTDILNLNAVQP